MRNEVRRLNWDSEFLGFDTMRLDLSGSELTPVQEYVNVLREAQAELTYVFIPPGKEDLVLAWERVGARLVDTKIVFQCDVGQRSEVSDETVRSFSSHESLPERLRDIALVSGQHSRFLTDPQMPEGTYERLYNLWLERSLSREIAHEVLVSEADARINGFVTVTLQRTIAEIGLIAVDPSSQGSGIGARLIDAVFMYAAEHACTAVHVATQLENTGACRFYERKGFTELSRKYVLHYWTKAEG